MYVSMHASLGLDCFLHLVCHFVCVRSLLKHCLGTKWAGSTPNGRDEVGMEEIQHRPSQRNDIIPIEVKPLMGCYRHHHPEKTGSHCNRMCEADKEIQMV